MKNNMRDLLLAAFISLVVYSFLGFFFGMLSTIDARMGSASDGCVYRSAAAYVNPGYLGACELFRARFNKEQPVEYVPEPVKKLN